MPFYFTPPVADVDEAKVPKVALALQSDTGTLGDNRTALKQITVNVTNLEKNGVVWLDLDNNDSFDIGVDRPVVSGMIDLQLAEGENAFRFYQMDSDGLVSDPALLVVHLDIAASMEQTQAMETALAKAALAYLGRPMTDTEHDALMPLLLINNGTPDALVNQLSQNPEFRAVYSGPNLTANLNRASQILFGRDATAAEVSFWQNWLNEGGNGLAIPWLMASNAAGADSGVLAARVLFAQQATANHEANLTAAGTSERTLLEVERGALENILSLDDVTYNYETLVSTAKTIGIINVSFAGPRARLDTGSDTGTLGDYATTQEIVKINVSGIRPGALAWLDTDGNGAFNPGTDYPVINGSVYAALTNGPNALVFYQMLGGEVSSASYLALTRGDVNSPITQLRAPVLDLQEADDDGVDRADNVTSKYLVRIDVTGLDPLADSAWIDVGTEDGIFDVETDVLLPAGAATATVLVELEEGVNGLSVFQTRDGIKSAPGRLTVMSIQNTDVVEAGDAAFIGTTLMLEFSRPIDWGSLDTNGDGKLTAGIPGTAGVELQIAWGGDGGFFLDNPANWDIVVPGYGSRYLTATGITAGDTDPLADNTLSILVVGVPDVGGGITSDVLFDDIS